MVFLQQDVRIGFERLPVNRILSLLLNTYRKVFRPCNSQGRVSARNCPFPLNHFFGDSFETNLHAMSSSLPRDAMHVRGPNSHEFALMAAHHPKAS